MCFHPFRYITFFLILAVFAAFGGFLVKALVTCIEDSDKCDYEKIIHSEQFLDFGATHWLYGLVFVIVALTLLIILDQLFMYAYWGFRYFILGIFCCYFCRPKPTRPFSDPERQYERL